MRCMAMLLEPPPPKLLPPPPLWPPPPLAKVTLVMAKPATRVANRRLRKVFSRIDMIDTHFLGLGSFLSRAGVLRWFPHYHPKRERLRSVTEVGENFWSCC